MMTSMHNWPCVQEIHGSPILIESLCWIILHQAIIWTNNELSSIRYDHFRNKLFSNLGWIFFSFYMKEICFMDLNAKWLMTCYVGEWVKIDLSTIPGSISLKKIHHNSNCICWSKQISDDPVPTIFLCMPWQHSWHNMCIILQQWLHDFMDESKKNLHQSWIWHEELWVKPASKILTQTFTSIRALNETYTSGP